MERVRAYVGLGSNLDEPVRQLDRALAAIGGLPRTCLLARSRYYQNPPMDGSPQPDYVNAVAELETGLAPETLLDRLLCIEREQGRERGAVRWGPRTLDLDLLVYGGLQRADTRLTLPHPGIAERAFVLLPLHEIAPSLQVPGHGPISALLSSISAVLLEQLTPIRS